MAKPTSLPIWRALAAEAGVAADQIGDGVTLLNSMTPEYHYTFARAFLPLATGFERACKLVIQVDARLTTGSFLRGDAMKKHGHKLDALVLAVDAINRQRGGNVRRPDEPIHSAIIATLTSFAAGGRYHNLDYLAGRTPEDPVMVWWQTVVLPILDQHYLDSQRQQRDEAEASAMSALFDDHASVSHTHVAGGSITSIHQGALEGSRMRAAIPWIRLYTLQLARWLAETMQALSWASHQVGDEEIPELHEFFRHFFADDRDMKRRKQWRRSL